MDIMTLWFSLIVLVASVLGAMAGIGGGVIIRPALDAFHYFDEAIIPNMISAFCVLAVALTSVSRHLLSHTKVDFKDTIFLGLGAIGGGILGQYLFSLLKSGANSNILVITQSAILIALLVLVILYMTLFKGKFSLHVHGWYFVLLIGLFLGLSSSFLGIGGGPINVAVLVFFFSMDMKNASVNSLVIIIFSQTSKIVQALVAGELQSAPMNWGLLAILVGVAVIGSLTGTFLNKKVPEKGLLITYLATMVAIILLNVYDIAIYSLA
jgi:uncharacterized membrane protein YfcA